MVTSPFWHNIQESEESIKIQGVEKCFLGRGKGRNLEISNLHDIVEWGVVFYVFWHAESNKSKTKSIEQTFIHEKLNLLKKRKKNSLNIVYEMK